MDLEEIKLVLWHIAEGMKKLHERNIIHRDLNPDNILIEIDYQNKIIDIKISDLGFSKQLEDPSSFFVTRLGTPQYMAPELKQFAHSQFLGFTNKVDVFSFGLIIYFMIYGGHAYNLQSDKINFEKGIIVIPPKNANKIPESFEPMTNLMKKCLEINPSKRISFDEIIKDSFFQAKPLEILKQIFSPKDFKITEGDHSTYLIHKDKQNFVKIYNEKFYKDKVNQKYINREITFLNRSKPINHIVKFIGHGLVSGSETVWLAFRYCNGESLNKLFEKRSKDP